MPEPAVLLCGNCLGGGARLVTFASGGVARDVHLCGQCRTALGRGDFVAFHRSYRERVAS